MEIPLRLKYRRVTNGRFKSSQGGNNKAARQHRQLTPAEIERHLRQPKKIMVISPTGKAKMVTI